MIKKLLLIFGLALTPLFAEDLPITIQDLSQGEINQFDSMLIPDNSVHEARNVYFDDVSMIRKRKGMSKLNTLAIGNSGPIYNQFDFRKSNGIDYHIVVASNTLYYRTSGATFTAFLASVSTATSVTNFEVFMDTLQFCNGTMNLSYWNTSNVYPTTTAYQPKYLLAWQNRLWIAGDTDEPSTLRSCAWLDPSNWTIPTSNAVATDPVLFDINSQDGQKIIGIKKSPNGYLLVLKEKSCWEIGGVDRDDFAMTLVSPDLGCVDVGSFVYKEGKANWLSLEGFVEYDGNTIKIISKPIQETVKNIQQLNIGRGSFVKNSPSDWGIFSSTSFVDITSVPGSLKNGFLTIGADNWYQPLSYHTGQIVKAGNSKIFIIRNGAAANANLGRVWCEVVEGGKFTISNVIDGGDYNNHFAYIPRSNQPIVRVDSNNIVHIVYWHKTTGNWFVYYSTSSDGITWSSTSIADTGISDTWANFDNNNYCLSLALDTANKPHIIYNPAPTSSKYQLQYYYYNTSWQNGGLFGNGTIAPYYKAATPMIDSNNKLNIICEDTSSTNIYHIYTTTGITATINPTETNIGIISGDYRSLNSAITSDNKIYIANLSNLDTNASGSWAEKTIEAYPPNNFVTNVIYLSDDNIPRVMYTKIVDGSYGVYYSKYDTVSGTFPAIKTITTGNKFNVDLYVDNNENSIGFYFGSDDKSVIVTSSGSYISEIWDTSYPSGISFDAFITQQTNNDYNVNHYCRTSASSTTITSNTWTEFIKNSVPSLAANRYIQYKCDISTDVLSNIQPLIDEVNIAYHAISGSNRLSSMYYKQRVYNSVSISSGSILDRMIIYDKNNKWTEQSSAINCMNLLNLNGTPYLGSDNGFIYQMETGNDDDGSPIDAYILTKSYALGAIYQKNLSKLFILANDSGNWNLNLDYYLDKSPVANETFAIDLDQTAGLINYKIPLKKNNPFGTIQFKLYNGNANEPFDVYGLFGYYRMQPLR